MIDHVAELTGSIAGIGIGTDMSLGSYPPHAHDPWGEPDYGNISEAYGRAITPDQRSARRMVEGFDDYSHVVGFAERLLARGFRDADVHAILGGNYLRLFDQIWTPRGGA
jgi:microsomal dipeptidase-like Zn-dependent dipeptidase